LVRVFPVLARETVVRVLPARTQLELQCQNAEVSMVDRRTQQEEGANLKKDPEDWTTGDEPMTAAQRSYMHTLAEEAGEEVRDDLTKAEASKKIDELQEKTGRKPPS
jgi:DUF3072 family protein